MFKVPDELSDEVVAPVNCALSQVTYGLSVAGLKYGDTLVVQGLGGLASTPALSPRRWAPTASSASTVSQPAGGGQAVRRRRDIDEPGHDAEPLHEGASPHGQRGADVVAEVVGVPDAFPEGLQLLRDGGTLLEIGNITFGSTAPFDPSQIVASSRRIYGVATYDPWVIPKALDFLVRTRNKYPFDRIASHKYKLEDINKAFEEAEWKAAGAEKSKITRALIVP